MTDKERETKRNDQKNTEKVVDYIIEIEEVLGDYLIQKFFNHYNSSGCVRYCHNVSRVWLLGFDKKIEENNFKEKLKFIFDNTDDKDKIYDTCPNCGRDF